MESLKEVNKGTRLTHSSKMKAEGKLMALSTYEGRKESLREEHSKLMNNCAKGPNASKDIVNTFKPKIRKGLFNQ